MTSTVQQYFDLTKKYKNTYGEKSLLLMQVGSFFECYAIQKDNNSYEGSNIVEFTSTNDMIIAKKNSCIGEKNVVMAGFGINQLEKYVKKMLAINYTVIVYTQDIQAKNTTRSLSCIYSPGTYFENTNNSYNGNLSNNIMCIWLDYSKANNVIKNNTLTIGISIINILTGKIIIYEYNHLYINSPTTYDQLEKYCAIYNPSEVILITNYNNSDTFLDTVISFTNINSQKIHKIYSNDNFNNTNINNNSELHKLACDCEKQVFQEHIIDKIYGEGSFLEKSEFQLYSIANNALCFLLLFVEKHNPVLIKNIDYPKFDNHNLKLTLANHSLKQLNILSDHNNDNKLSCVANFLNNCLTNIGKRKFNYDLLNPICNIEELNLHYNIVEEFLNKDFFIKIKNELQEIKDIEKMERKIHIKKIDPKDFVIIYNNLSCLNKIFNIISKSKCNTFKTYINDIFDNNKLKEYCNRISEFIESSLNIEKAASINIDKLSNYSIEELDFFNINYNKDLNTMFKNCIDSREQLEAIIKYLSNMLYNFEKSKKNTKDTSKSTADYDNYIKIHETSKNDISLILTKRRASILKDIIQNYVIKDNKNCTISYISKYANKEEFLTLDLSIIDFKLHGTNQSTMILFSSHINEITNSIQNSKEILLNNILVNYNKFISEFLEVNNLKQNTSILSYLSRFISYIDTFYCKAYNASKYNYCKPKIEDNNNSKSYIKFEKLRHILIERLNNKELYVTNDLSIANSKSKMDGMLLYGTNAVGKTSFIKSVGISLILAQSGNYVPCSNFIYYPYNYLFTRILGNDNLFKSLSTFAVEMCELRTILKNATPNSIILGDELCSGTESTSALSIFVSSLEKLHSINCTFLFATHFHEILDYDEIKQLKRLKTFHMTVVFDKENDLLIYDRKLREGPGESMYGLEVCKSLNMPDDFIERAYFLRNKYNGNSELKKTKYNSKKIKSKICEFCKKNNSCDIHHLQFQKNASNDGIIENSFKKNHAANLVNICEECHTYIHKNNIEYKKIKTTQGYTLKEL